MRVELHSEARNDLRAAALWYDEQHPGLGDEFVGAVARVIERIGAAPASFPIWPGTEGGPSIIRRALVDRFPYAVGFEVHPEHVLVLAIPHTRRRPLEWLRYAF
ncbi:type II toxin-antitoxin system RelE/ParE family toxin [Polyangium mundeleinium]|uniref:Type II toxin-antitoxin system RelE/ParE family toxin n=1 Tax=Polyangium mundeleinium TaxID=2995306 RepID=A0ABT5EPW1_9BACT|nr:type II toxin-antitoxin system RelE/ParE family toxin [Polyangium mundeleinium]MDC0743369.1 type II toxin-antitoxin system RelE/ParE family toxin [Polyangium mundeleinium]